MKFYFKKDGNVIVTNKFSLKNKDNYDKYILVKPKYVSWEKCFCINVNEFSKFFTNKSSSTYYIFLDLYDCFTQNELNCAIEKFLKLKSFI